MRSYHISASASRATKNVKARHVEFRKKSSTAAAASAKNSKSVSTLKTTKKGLQEVPGVGPVNEQLLKGKGISSVELLRSVYEEKARDDDAIFITYLQDEIGIRSRHHCRSIAQFLSGKRPQRITLSIEGNISAGKTTLLSWLDDEQFEIRDLCEVVREPVEAWQRVGGSEGNNILERFYNDPVKYAYEFQNYVFLTRMDVNHRTFEGQKPLRLLERSVFSDRLVFIRAVHESKWMDDLQLQMYDSWFNPILKEVPGLIPDGFIYLRAQPGTCMKRLRRRNRSEEAQVAERYLEDLHSKHEEWFKKEDWTDKRSLLFPADRKETGARKLLDTFPPDIPIPKELENCIIWLGNDGITRPESVQGEKSNESLPAEVKQAVWQIPALVLDCDEDINVDSDVDAKREYARKVQAYFEFVRRYGKRRRVHGLPADEMNEMLERRFWKSEMGESLRRRWLMVNSLSEQEIKNWATAKQ